MSIKGCENVRFTNQARLDTHIKNKHTRVMCGYCHKEMCNEFLLQRHIAKAHGIKPEGSIDCQFCSMYFKSQPCLDKHVRKNHQ